jgi:hypothetical protein
VADNVTNPVKENPKDSAGAVVREERYLKRKFGCEYLKYMRKARRWVWPGGNVNRKRHTVRKTSMDMRPAVVE